MITKRSVKTFEAKIYVGFRKRYSQEVPGDAALVARQACREAVASGWCLTVQDINYIYTPTFTTGQETPVGGEPGAVIGAINYPRFPSDPEELKAKVLALASVLLERLDQERVTVVFSDETVLVERVPGVN